MGKKLGMAAVVVLAVANGFLAVQSPATAAVPTAEEEVFLCQGVCDCFWTERSQGCHEWVHDGCDWAADCN